MMQIIESTLGCVLKDFKASIANCKGLCDLKALTYKSGNLPDYTNPFIQQYYMLRYFPAYLFEYFTIYSRILSEKLVRAPLNVLSIGAGCFVDYYGLHLAVKSVGGYGSTLYYTGVDLVDWKYQSTLGRENVWSIQKDITEWETLDDTKYNVIMLPKSIGEFPPKTFTHVKQMLRNSSFETDRVCLACSLMEKGCHSDIDRFTALVKVMTDHHGFTCKACPSKFWSFTKNQGIRGIISDWIYPDDAKVLLSALLNKCPTYAHNGKSCKPDCDVLNRHPILTTGYIAYTVIGLKRV